MDKATILASIWADKSRKTIKRIKVQGYALDLNGIACVVHKDLGLLGETEVLKKAAKRLQRGWTVSEVITGMNFAFGATRAAAINRAWTIFERQGKQAFLEQIKRVTAR